MAKIYSLPEQFEKIVPKFDFNKSNEENFINDLKEWIVKRNPTQDNIGEIINFQVADGLARYMITTTKPLSLIHLPLGNAYKYLDAHKLTKKDVDQKIKFQKIFPL
jgi:hypothetical protein